VKTIRDLGEVDSGAVGYHLLQQLRLGIDHCAKSETPNIRPSLECTIRCSEDRLKVPELQGSAESPIGRVEASAPPQAVSVERSAKVEEYRTNRGG
jgi:hypothetical protein